MLHVPTYTHTLCEESEESSSKENESQHSVNNAEVSRGPEYTNIEARHTAMTLLDNLQCGHALADMGQPSLTLRNTLELLQDLSRLRKAHNRLALKAKDKQLDVVFRARLLAMAGVLDIYLAPELKYTWKEALFIVSKAQGHGTHHARCVWKWLLEYLWTEELPFHRLAQAQRTVLEDEDIAKVIQLQLMEKSKQGFLKAEDLVDIVASLEIRDQHG
jgi:hypothetical protein